MASSTVTETGRPVAIKDEGVTLATNVASVDFTGVGVAGSVLGNAVTEQIGDTLATWGSITGTLANQTDLQAALDLKANLTSPLSVFASTSSAQLAGVISDETGSGALVFNTDPKFITAISPLSNDGGALGTASLMWSDLFLASGAVINFNNGDVTLTHSSNLLTLAGGGLALTGLVGIDYNPGSDVDGDIATVGVTGAPKLSWDESQDQFALNKGLNVVNSAWLSAVDNAGTGFVNMFKNNTSDQIEVGGALSIDGSWVFPTDAGAVTAANMPLTGSATNSYTFQLGNTNGLTVYGTGDGAGGVSAAGVLIGIGTITPTYDLDLQKAGGTSNVSLRAYNTSNTAIAAHAILEASVGGTTSTGDPQFRLTIPSGNSWYMGADNSVTSDPLIIGLGTAVGTTPYITLLPTAGSTSVAVAVRLLNKQGADVASATNLALGSDGNVFEITGTTKIDLISNVGWQNGATIILIANESVVIDDGTATSGTNITINLAGGDYSMTADDTLTLLLSETTAGGQAWREVCRSVN